MVKPFERLILIGIAILFMVAQCLYVIYEGQRALIIHLGELKKTSTGQLFVAEPGLHFKWPFVEQLKRFDGRLHTLEPEPSRIVTLEQKDLLVDFFTQWKIINLERFYKRTSGQLARAELLLSQQLNDRLRAEFGKRKMAQIIADERLNTMEAITASARQEAEELGIQIVDVRIKRIDLPPEVSQTVYSRMRADRFMVATQHRSAGQAKAQALEAQAKADASVTIATAKNEAAEIRARGDRIAAKIYADAYEKDPEFFSFLGSLEAYQHSLGRAGDMLVIKPSGEFFQYFHQKKKS